MHTLTRPEGTEPADLHVSRRDLAGLVAGGYAVLGAAAQAAPIATPATGLTTGMVDMRGLPGFVARPAAAGRRGAVIVVSEVFGLHEYIRDVCRRFAALGYVAVAPDFFHRADGAAGMLTLTDRTALMKIVATATDAQVQGDVATTLEWLAAQPFGAPRVGITGFCWGGSVVWNACARQAQLKAGVAWYGRLTEREGMGAGSAPLDTAAGLKAPVLGLYGALDKGIPLDTVEAMRAKLPAGSSIVVYPQGEHGFHADYRASYNEAAATDGWARLLAHFKANGVTA